MGKQLGRLPPRPDLGYINTVIGQSHPHWALVITVNADCILIALAVQKNLLNNNNLNHSGRVLS